MRDPKELVDAALQAAVTLPAQPAFRTWCDAYRAGHDEEEAAKRAFRSIWWDLARGRADDFSRLLAHAEARMSVLRPEELAGWAQASAARAVVELIRAQRLQSTEATQEQCAKAGAIAAAALRFAEAATAQPSLGATPSR
jgi:hypothetical protein